MLRDPRDGSIHDEYVHDGWNRLRPGRRYGSAVPRVWTPPLRELTPETSLGFDLIEFARDDLGVTLLPWQRWLAIHLLELREDGRLRFRKAIVLVARQSGKSTFMQILSLYMMLVLAWPLTLGTAQDLGTAEEVWEEVVGMLDDDEELSALVERVTKVNGKKALKLTTGERYLVKAANRRAGRGLRGNLVILDELREQTTWAAWAAITKTTNAQERALIVGISNAGDVSSVVLRSQRIALHKALGDPDGLDVAADLPVSVTGAEIDAVLADGLVERFDVFTDEEEDDLTDEEEDADLAEDVEAFYDDEEHDDDWFLEDDDDGSDSSAIFEWSAPKGCDRMDRKGWAAANPALGHIVMSSTIAGQANPDGGEPEWVFRTEVLCQWPDESLNGPFPPGAWAKGQNVPYERADGSVAVADGIRYSGVDAAGWDHGENDDRMLIEDLDVCIEQSDDRELYSILAAGKRRDGTTQVELIAYRSGNAWIEEFLLHDPKYGGKIRRVTGQTRGAPVSAFMAHLTERWENKRDRWSIPVVPWGGPDLTIACALMYDAVVPTRANPVPAVRHHRQGPLDAAAGNAQTAILTGGFVIDRRNSEIDAAPIMGFAGALWLSTQPVPRAAPLPPPARAVKASDIDRRSAGRAVGTSDVRSMKF